MARTSALIALTLILAACGPNSALVTVNLGEPSTLQQDLEALQPLPEPPPTADQATSERRWRLVSTLVADLRRSIPELDEQALELTWNYTDNLRLLWGPGLSVPMATIGCVGQSDEQRVRCFFDRYPGAFGIRKQHGELMLTRLSKLDNGTTIMRFVQALSGVRVDGSDVVVTLDAEGRLQRIYSTYVAGLSPAWKERQTLGAVLTRRGKSFYQRRLRQQLGVSKVTLIDNVPVLYVAREQRSTAAVPARRITLQSSGVDLELVVAAATGDILTARRRAVSWPAAQVNKTRVAYPLFTGFPCGFYFGSCFPGLVCSDHMFHSGCVMKCNNDSQCSNVYPGWRCWEDPNDAYGGYCYTADPDSWPYYLPRPLEIYNASGWTRSSYAFHRQYRDLVDITDDLIDFHYGVLFRGGWNDRGGTYTTILEDCCESTCTRLNQGCSALARTAGTGTVSYGGWYNLAKPELGRRVSTRNVLAHEWGHNIARNDAGGWLSSHECLNENIADLYGAFFAAHELGDSSHRYASRCGDVERMWNTWGDDLTGLAPSCDGLPYAQRSRFDWFDCTGRTWRDLCGDDGDCLPYERCQGTSSGDRRCTNSADAHNNGAIWRRFARLLAEGSGTFDVDQNSESTGIQFAGIGYAAAARVVHEATLNLSTSTTLRDWLRLLLSAGLLRGCYSQVQHALSLSGFIVYTSGPSYDLSDAAPTRHYFGDWEQSAYKYFKVFKDRNTSSLRVVYSGRHGRIRDEIAASTDAAPAVAVHNRRLYIFWRDQSSGAIRFKYYRYDGYKSRIYDLGAKSIFTVGAFDAVDFGGDLYLVYTDTSYGWVFISRCSANICTTEGWHAYYPGSYKRYAGWKAHAGLAADAAFFLNGTGWSHALYVASAYKGTADRMHQIRIDKLGSRDVREQTVWIPNHFPSSKTEHSLGIKAMAAAFPEATAYLYLSWKDLERDGIYSAIVQRFDDNDNSNSWVTRSIDTLLSATRTGVRLQKGDGQWVDEVVYVHTDAAGRISYSKLFGRY